MFQQRQQFDELNSTILDADKTIADTIKNTDKAFEGAPQRPPGASGTLQRVSTGGPVVDAGPQYGTASVNDPITPAVIATVGIIRVVQLWIRDILKGGTM